MNTSINAVILRWADSKWTWFPLGSLLPPKDRPLPMLLAFAHGLSGLICAGGVLAALSALMTDRWSAFAFAIGGVFGAVSGLLAGLILTVAWNRRAGRLTAAKETAAVTDPSAQPLSLVQRWLVQPMLLGAILATGALVVIALENLRGALALRTFQAELAANGTPATLSEVVPPPVADDRNLALAPLLKPLFDYDGRPGQWRDSNAYHRVAAVTREHQRSFRGFASAARRPESSWQDGVPLDLELWQAYYRSSTEWPQSPQPGRPAQDVLLALGRWDPQLNELREAVAARPECRFPIRYEDGFAAMLTHLSVLKSYANVLSLRSVALLAENRGDEALADVLLVLRLSDALQTEPLIISALVRINIDTLALQPIWEGCQSRRWTEAQLTALQRALATRDYRGDFRRSLNGERVLTSLIYDDLVRHGARTIELYADLNSDILPDDTFLRTYLRCIPRGWIRQSQVIHGRYIEALRRDLERSPNYAGWPDRDDRFDRMVHKRSLVHVLAAMLAPALDNAPVKAYEAEARRNLALVALALERHRLATGAYPDDLTSLVPRFLPDPVVDPMDGQSLRYSRTADDQYRLYSVGRNVQDDGGRRSTRKAKSINERYQPSDVVWQ